MENVTVQSDSVINATDTSVNGEGLNATDEGDEDSKAITDLGKFGLSLAGIGDMISMRDLLTAMPKEQWDWLRVNVLAGRREESDDTTKEAAKLFQLSGTVGLGSEFSLKFAPVSEGAKSRGGIYRMTERTMKKGREGSVVLTLVNINDDDDKYVLSSRTDGAKVISCKLQTRVVT